jgi:hypothetical protein
MPRRCSICSHHQRRAIDAALTAGESFRHISARFETSTSALNRHKAHVGARLKAAAARKGEMLEDSLLSELQRIRGELWGLLAAAKGEGDNRAAIATLRELRETITAVDGALAKAKPAEAERPVMTPAERREAMVAQIMGVGHSRDDAETILALVLGDLSLRDVLAQPPAPVPARRALPPPAMDPEVELPEPREYVHASARPLQPLPPVVPPPPPAPAGPRHGGPSVFSEDGFAGALGRPR